ncbi:tectonic-3-like isoform X2 [Ruditapes philippinarum]|uniref:tectonic-3-like isoform X2 n=1 Tax=Ruditapes philippinarum TaxID=129788 RepID=UPI00295AA1DA|nr:tectonic-3-like isoform X2 [Ruditapes philippinarum]
MGQFVYLSDSHNSTFVYIMAAKMKLCRCLFKPIFYFCLLCFLISLNCVSYVHSATQPTTTLDPNVTVTTDPPTTTTEPTTTTTIPPTTTIAPDEPRTVIGDTVIGQCLCDLTGNECDVNCCCDEDCTQADKSAFTCDTRSFFIDNKVCYKEEVFPFSNSPADTTTDGGLFCIFYDNYKERNYYLDPDFILDIPSFNSYVERYANPGRQEPVSVQEPVFDLNSFYRKGDTVYIVYPNEAQGTFVLPAPSVSSQCNDQNSVGYLNEVTTECTRSLTLDANTCTNTAGLAASSYYQNFRVVKTSGLFGYVVNGTFVGISTTTQAPPLTTPATTLPPSPGSNTTDNSTTVAATTASTTTPAPTTTAQPTTVDPSQVQTLYNNPYIVEINATTMTHLCVQADNSIVACTFTDVPDPTFNAATCENVVQEARYFFTTDGSNGIAEVQVQFVFRNIQQANLPLTQRFSISYNSLTDSNDTFARSGNPGYLIGKPLLYGTLNVTVSADGVESQEILIATEASLGLTVVRPSASGVCADASARIPVLFGENIRTGCQIGLNLSTISTAQCQTIQETIVRTLEGPNVPSLNQDQTAWVENNRYVATFGNTDRLKVGDWVKVISSNRPLPSSAKIVGTDTCSLSMGLHIQVLYANVGALANPQAKIIGVALLYDSLQNVKFRCEGAFCQPQTQTLTQPFEVSQTVSFVDVSQPASKFAGEAPIFIARIPNDFFYPFLYYTNSARDIVPKVVPVTFIAVVIGLLNIRQFIL